MTEQTYTVDQLQALAASAAGKANGTLTGWWLVIDPPNPAALEVRMTLGSGFKHAVRVTL